MRLLELAESRATGTPGELAEKLDITERQLYNYLADMRKLGHNIEFCRTKRSYILLETVLK